MLREERKLVHAPSCYQILDFRFKGKKVGTKGVTVCACKEVRTLREGLGRRGVSGLLDLRAPKARVCPAGPLRSARSGQLPGGRRRGGRLSGPSRPQTGASCMSLASLPSKGDLGMWDGLVAWFNNQLGSQARGLSARLGVIEQRARGTCAHARVPTRGPSRQGLHPACSAPRRKILMLPP